MGTRADFYIGRGQDAEWLGSVAFDGYPEGITPHSEETERRWGRVSHKDAEWPVGESLLEATTEQQFRERLMRYFRYREDVTLPADGWPWPWESSHTSDYAYTFDGERVLVSCFGRCWLPAAEPEPEEWPEGKAAAVPDMSDRKAVTYGPRSGLIVITATEQEAPDA